MANVYVKKGSPIYDYLTEKIPFELHFPGELMSRWEIIQYYKAGGWNQRDIDFLLFLIDQKRDEDINIIKI